MKLMPASVRAGLVASAVVAVGFAQTNTTRPASNSPTEPVKLEKFEVTGERFETRNVDQPRNLAKSVTVE